MYTSKTFEDYIDYCNTKRYQKQLLCMSPLEYRIYLSGSTA
ncbi:IS3 family transposase [Clostridium sp. WILCCON 0269]|uniref:IS3 family transposase n=1 Tax=Candidatus Clostridium eludens TaxID=3381663 RepID=A0ABW8SQ71_9CLOT